MIQQNPRASRAPRARRAATTTTTPRATRSTAPKTKRTTPKTNRPAAQRNDEGERGGIRKGYGASSRAELMPCAPQVQPAPVGERVGVALALLAVVLAVLVARAVATLAALARKRAPARDSVVLVQMTAVPADPVVHFPHPRNVFRTSRANLCHDRGRVKNRDTGIGGRPRADDRDAAPPKNSVCRAAPAVI